MELRPAFSTSRITARVSSRRGPEERRRGASPGAQRGSVGARAHAAGAGRVRAFIRRCSIRRDTDTHRLQLARAESVRSSYGAVACVATRMRSGCSSLWPLLRAERVRARARASRATSRAPMQRVARSSRRPRVRMEGARAARRSRCCDVGFDAEAAAPARWSPNCWHLLRIYCHFLAQILTVL